MFERNGKICIVLFVFLSTLLSARVSALVMVHSNGDWPQDWPAQLEPYRAQAKTYEIATGSQENVYEIRFNSRAELENIWPVVLKLQDSGATLKLTSIGTTSAGVASVYDNTRAGLRIHSYVWPAYDVNYADGKSLRPGPPWPDSIKSPEGHLPEYIMRSQDGNSWVPVNDNNPMPFIFRARTELELVVDGAIIDLNRIHLPSDAVIIDNRRLIENQKLAEDHTDWIARCLKIVGRIKPGAARRDLLDVFKTEGGFSNRLQRTYVYKECPYIKVDVRFRPDDDSSNKSEDPNDVITEISKPYLQFSIMD